MDVCKPNNINSKNSTSFPNPTVWYRSAFVATSSIAAGRPVFSNTRSGDRPGPTCFNPQICVEMHVALGLALVGPEAYLKSCIPYPDIKRKIFFLLSF